MDDAESILEGARSIRPYLGELLGDEATGVDTQLALLLEQGAAGQKVDNRILGLLADHEPTREWIRTYLNADQAEARVTFVKSFDPTPGDPDPIAAEKYVCPINGDTWCGSGRTRAKRSRCARTASCPTGEGIGERRRSHDH